MGQWWHTPLILALGSQTQADLCEFEASLVYKVSSRTARAFTQSIPVLEKRKRKKNPTLLSAEEMALGLRALAPLLLSQRTVSEYSEPCG